ncbi:MAG: hypothetical protein ACLU6H_01080 [Lachnospiraceae bacterium]|nr:hypothetical protein [Lachnospiraceae bacterium]
MHRFICCSAFWLSQIIGYTAVCIASPLAWLGAIALLIPVYYRMMRGVPAAV